MSCSRFAAFISLNLDIAKGKHPHSSSPRRGRLRRQEFHSDIFGLREYLAMKRVRREIRDLSTLEWQEIVNAFWVMKTTSDSDGKKFFGAKFISYDSMVAKHIAAGNILRGAEMLSIDISSWFIVHHWSSFIVSIAKPSIQEATRRTLVLSLAYFTELGCWN